MDLELTDEQRLISETAREFVDNEVVPRARENDRAAALRPRARRRLGEMGYLGAPVAEEYGGRGLDYISYGLIVEQVGRGDSAMRTVVSVQTSLVCGSIERWGTEEQKQRWLPRLCSGEALGCFGLTEPDTGSDAAGAAHPREKIDGGWRISRPEDVDLARQLRRGRADLRPDRPREEAPRASPASSSPPTSEGFSPRRSTASSACAPRTPARDRARRGRGRRRRAARRGRRGLQGRDVARSTRAATRSPPAASASATAASTPRSPTRRSASSSAFRSRASSSSRR